MVNRDKLRGILPSQQITLAVEDVFGVSLKNEEAASILTVGQLYEHILPNFSIDQQEGCLRSIAFYRLRRALLTCGVSRDRVKLNAWLRDLLLLNSMLLVLNQILRFGHISMIRQFQLIVYKQILIIIF